MEETSRNEGVLLREATVALWPACHAQDHRKSFAQSVLKVEFSERIGMSLLAVGLIPRKRRLHRVRNHVRLSGLVQAGCLEEAVDLSVKKTNG